MKLRTEAFITPRLVRWARERAGASHDQIANTVKAPIQRVLAWEEGTARPLFRQAQKLARMLNVPFGFLYLTSPPEERIPLPDFRTLANGKVRKPSPEFLDLLNSVLLKHQWYKEYLQNEGAPIREYVGRFKLTDDSQSVAADIRRTLHLDEALRKACSNGEELLRALIARAESVGILVMRSGVVASNARRKLAVNEFRGFAISDSTAPLVFINSRDARSAQTFTLVHELAHIWVGATGISDAGLRAPGHDIESFCNAVAAETLVPQDLFTEHWATNRTIDQNMRSVAQHFRVSTLVALRRALDLRRLTFSQFREFYRREEDTFKAKPQQNKQSGGDFYATLKARNSSTFTETVVGAALEGRLLRRDAASLLGVRVPTVEKIAIHLMAESRR